ncbi:MAG: acylneuraminate cytidylyltransferase family protein [Chloroflexi bacterium]|nr:acylneuraminate cytidylyltransferase family protein [Chloroflexota bacterium]
MAVLAIVPARGGSKGLPRKNIRMLAGQPVIAYAIQAGQQARLVDRVIVSTDDPEIADVAARFGAEVPFLRPAELAADDTPDLPVFQHAVRWLEEHEGYRPELIVNLRPTSPLRRPEHVDGAIQLLLESGADSAKTVCLARQHPHKMWRLCGTELLPFLDTHFRLERGPDVPRAELEPVYWQNGLVDVMRRELLMERNMTIGGLVAGYVTEPEVSIDLDGPLDFLLAEALLAQRAR